MAAEEANISRASSRLNVSQPAVSRQIRDLEEELGVSLFNRKHDGLALTNAGATALTHAREVLRQANVLTDAMQAFGESDQMGLLRVGFIPTALPGFLADGLRSFRQSHRQVRVQIYEMSPQQQEQALGEDKIDLALLGHACPELKKRYRVEPIRKVPMAIALPDDHPLAKRKAIDLSELSSETFLSLHEKHFPGRPELMKSMFERAGITPRIALKADGLSSLLGQVGGGNGVALVPADADVLPHTGVVFGKLRRPKVTLVSSAVWEQARETPALVEFVQTLK